MVDRYDHFFCGGSATKVVAVGDTNRLDDMTALLHHLSTLKHVIHVGTYTY